MIEAIFLVLGLALSLDSSHTGQSCLHQDSSDQQQLGRRRAALSAVRLINTIEAREKNSGRPYPNEWALSATEYYRSQRASRADTIDLDTLPSSLAGWKLTLNTASDSYWLILADTIDPCGFAYITNQEGLIYKSEPIR